MLMESLGTNQVGRLTLGGADVETLADTYGTPLYLMDENEIRRNCRRFTQTLRMHYGDHFQVSFASKAFCCKAMYPVLDEEGLGADVVSGGELYTALAAGFPARKLTFHGNSKTTEELQYALDAQVGLVVVDNGEELRTLHRLAQEAGQTVSILLRVRPGVKGHTHAFVQTGQEDSKFGLSVATGEFMEIAKQALSLPHIRLQGIHCHIGSQIFDIESYRQTVRVMMQTLAKLREVCGEPLPILNIGGGFGVRYLSSDAPPPVETFLTAIAAAVKEEAARLSLPLPELHLEPGRYIVAQAGITVYTIQSVKQIDETKFYYLVDGGMTDNPRYILYDARYEALLPARPLANKTRKVTIAGRCCESGDMVATDVPLPPAKAGDRLAVLVTGAFNYAMASHYNRVPNPPVVFVRDGQDRLAVRREAYADVCRNDV